LYSKFVVNILKSEKTLEILRGLYKIILFFFSSAKYGAFLAVVALLELGAGASVYAYRTTLNEGFDQGLNESMATYGQDHSKSSHIDTMQSTVSTYFYSPSIIPIVLSIERRLSKLIRNQIIVRSYSNIWEES